MCGSLFPLYFFHLFNRHHHGWNTYIYIYSINKLYSISFFIFSPTRNLPPGSSLAHFTFTFLIRSYISIAYGKSCRLSPCFFHLSFSLMWNFFLFIYFFVVLFILLFSFLFIHLYWMMTLMLLRHLRWCLTERINLNPVASFFQMHVLIKKSMYFICSSCHNSECQKPTLSSIKERDDENKEK